MAFWGKWVESECCIATCVFKERNFKWANRNACPGRTWFCNSNATAHKEYGQNVEIQIAIKFEETSTQWPQRLCLANRLVTVICPIYLWEQSTERVLHTHIQQSNLRRRSIEPRELYSARVCVTFGLHESSICKSVGAQMHKQCGL